MPRSNGTGLEVYGRVGVVVGVLVRGAGAVVAAAVVVPARLV